MKTLANKVQVRPPQEEGRGGNFLDVQQGPMMAPPKSLFSEEGKGSVRTPNGGSGSLREVPSTLGAKGDKLGGKNSTMKGAGLVSRMPIAERANSIGFERNGGKKKQGEPSEGKKHARDRGGKQDKAHGSKVANDNPQKSKKKKTPSDHEYQSPPIPDTYAIKKGDTFYGLEHRFGLASGELQRLNPQYDPRKLPIGLVIKLGKPMHLEKVLRSGGKKKSKEDKVDPNVVKSSGAKWKWMDPNPKDGTVKKDTLLAVGTPLVAVNANGERKRVSNSKVIQEP